MPREDRHPGPQSERQPGALVLIACPFPGFDRLFNFHFWQDFSSGGGTTTPAEETGARGLTVYNNYFVIFVLECLCGFPNRVKRKSRYL